jgi:hypothetical protein
VILRSALPALIAALFMVSAVEAKICLSGSESRYRSVATAPACAIEEILGDEQSLYTVILTRDGGKWDIRWIDGTTGGRPIVVGHVFLRDSEDDIRGRLERKGISLDSAIGEIARIAETRLCQDFIAAGGVIEVRLLAPQRSIGFESDQINEVEASFHDLATIRLATCEAP